MVVYVCLARRSCFRQGIWLQRAPSGGHLSQGDPVLVLWSRQWIPPSFRPSLGAVRWKRTGRGCETGDSALCVYIRLSTLPGAPSLGSPGALPRCPASDARAVSRCVCRRTLSSRTFATTPRPSRHSSGVRMTARLSPWPPPTTSSREPPFFSPLPPVSAACPAHCWCACPPCRPCPARVHASETVLAGCAQAVGPVVGGGP